MQNGDELVFLYQLVDGYTNTSYACHIASLAGISSDIVQRGHEVCMYQIYFYITIANFQYFSITVWFLLLYELTWE